MSIIIGYVPTPEGRAAFRRATEEASLRHTEVIVVNSHRGGPGFTGEEAMAFEAEMAEAAEGLAGRGLENDVRLLVRRNSPAKDLAAVAREYDADLIVVGLRRQHPILKALGGSDLLELLAIAPCAVLAVGAEG